MDDAKKGLAESNEIKASAEGDLEFTTSSSSPVMRISLWQDVHDGRWAELSVAEQLAVANKEADSVTEELVDGLTTEEPSFLS